MPDFTPDSAHSTTETSTAPLRIVLASSSPYRAALLRQILPHIETKSPNIDETASPNESALSLAKRLAAQKAQCIANNCPDALVIGSDQVAVISSNKGELLLGKPGNFETAHEQLSLCSGKTVTFITAVELINTKARTSQAFYDVYSIKFRQLDGDMITRYLHKEEPYDCAGAIKTEALGVTLIERFIGDDPNTLIGLPLIKLIDALKVYKINPL